MLENKELNKIILNNQSFFYIYGNSNYGNLIDIERNNEQNS